MLKETTVWTVREQLEHGYTVRKYCPRCQVGLGELDLAGVVEAGYGDRSPRDLRLKCPKCKTPVLITIHPPMGMGGPVSPGVRTT
jgi:phage FluMu protein Com